MAFLISPSSLLSISLLKLAYIGGSFGLYIKSYKNSDSYILVLLFTI